MEIRITAKSVYGETKYYPANGAAELLALIAKTKTLTVRDLELAKKMGATIVLDADATVRSLVAA